MNLGAPNQESSVLGRHLVRLRVSWAAFLVTVPAAGVAGFAVPRLEPAATTPTAVTLVALAASLWISFTAERDARLRLDRAKRAFAVHGELGRLLRDHWVVFLVVLVRLDVMVVAGLVTATWGSGPRVALWLELLAGIMMVLAWPSERKARLLIARARELRS
jgi:hypothetical protein